MSENGHHKFTHGDVFKFLVFNFVQTYSAEKKKKSLYYYINFAWKVTPMINYICYYHIFFVCQYKLERVNWGRDGKVRTNTP